MKRLRNPLTLWLVPLAGLLLAAEPAVAQIDLHETFYGVPSRGRTLRASAGHAGQLQQPGSIGPAAMRDQAGRSSTRSRRSGQPRIIPASAGTSYAAMGDDALQGGPEPIPTPDPTSMPSGAVRAQPFCPDCHGASGPWGEPAVTMGGCNACGMVETCDPCGPVYGCGAGPMRRVGHATNWWPMKDFSLIGGVHGFTNPVEQGDRNPVEQGDRAAHGRFGFNEGLNFGAPLGAFPGVGYQLGVLAAQSNFSDATEGTHDQVFLTGGVFQRRPIGLQWGVVFDLMHNVYQDSTDADLMQLRNETSWLFPSGNELGYFGAYGLGKELFSIEERQVDGYLDPTDMFAFFWRRHFSEGGEGRIWAGVSGRGDGLVGADIDLLLGRGFSLRNSFTYLIPKHNAEQGVSQDSWGVTIQLVWYLGQPARCALKSPYRPMINVADNTKFLSDFIQ